MTAASEGRWRPAADLQVLELRARLMRQARAFFEARGVMEVDTPVLGAATASDVHIASLTTRVEACDAGPLYLQTSPESAMKRLLAAGSGPIFQFARAFRDGESGPRHNPEFVLLEWYRTGFDGPALMEEVESLVGGLLGRGVPARRLSYRDAFEAYAGFDPFDSSLEDIVAHCRRLGWRGELTERDDGLDLIFSTRVQPALPPGMTFIGDFPPQQAALARVRAGDPPVAERFELFVDGVEVANGYHELADAGEQRRRIHDDLERRRARDLRPVPEDARLLAALEHGLPDCAGVALGFDRLVALAAGVDDIRRVMPFPIDRA